jgi:hypothetical protein
MEKSANAGGNAPDDLDAFFNAAGSENPQDISRAAADLVNNRDGSGKALSNHLDNLTEFDNNSNLEGKFIAVDAPGRDGKTDAPFILVPAHIHAYVPWWGWTAIGIGIAMLAAGVIFMPVWSLNRLASRLGDSNAENAELAMRSLVMNGDERTVGKLFDMAASSGESLTARLRAVDTMSLIGGVPEVDRALLRLELAGGTDEQVREAAIAARKQREASRTRIAQ